MSSQLQRIVDDIGRRLQRAAAIDDPGLNLQAYSPHYGPVDDVRLASILHREAPEDARQWVMSFSIAEAHEPVRLPACDDPELLPRVCAPIWFMDSLLGYLWVIDPDESMTDDEVALLQDAADRTGGHMYQSRLLDQLERGKERELLRDLLSGDDSLVQHATTELVAGDLVAQGARPVVLVVRPVVGEGQTLGEPERVILDASMEAARGGLSVGHAVHLARPGHGVLLAATNDPALRSRGLEAFGSELQELVSKRLTEAERVVVGIGDGHSELAAAGTSYRQAMRAADVLEIVPSFGDVGVWSSLGIYRILAQLPPAVLERETLHPGLQRLLEEPAHHNLVESLEAYFDRAGDVQATATHLALHRTSLYYRLSRVEEIADVDLKNGDDRLALHLGIKMARLAGFWGNTDTNRSTDT